MTRSGHTTPGPGTPPHRLPANAVGEAVNSLTRKLNNTTVSVKPVSAPPSRRSSFSMDNILHPGKKEKKRDDSKERESRKEKRISMPGSKGSKDKHKHSSATRAGPTKPAKFDLIVESPPLTLYGNANNSSGALFSGRLKLSVEDPSGSVKLEDFVMVLRATVSTHKPISKDCKCCIDKHDELKKWSFMSEPTTFQKDKDYQYPFSYLFLGHLPASVNAQLGSFSYSLFVQATTSTGEKIEFLHPLKILRAIPPGPEKSSIRIFPPTNLTGRVQLPPVVHPIGTFPVKMVLSGVVEKRTESQTRWRLRKMMWRIEEQCTILSMPCAKHAHKVSDGKAIQHVDSKTVASEDLKSGWKTDFDTLGGEISLEFEASLAGRNNYKASCGVASKAGLEVKHNLIIELIVAEEFCPNKNTTLITPTGAARVLRMQFNLLVTERAGMGISWDEEMPPMYEDVPPSPPSYGNTNKVDQEFGEAVAVMEDYSGPTIVPHDLERLSTHNSDGLPHYREIESTTDDLNEGLPMRENGYNHDEVVAESSGRRRYTGLRREDLEAETEAELHRRRRLEQAEEEVVVEDDFAEGMAGNAAVQQGGR